MADEEVDDRTPRERLRDRITNADGAYEGPETLDNPYVQTAQDGPVSPVPPGQEEKPFNPDGKYEPYRPLPVQDANKSIDPSALEFARVARGLMNTETDLTESRRRRLQGIIDSAQPKEREAANKLADHMLKSIWDMNSNPDTALTTQQTQAAYNDIETNVMMGLAIKRPYQLFKKKLGNSDPDVAMLDIAEVYANHFGADAEVITPLLELDPNTKKVTADSVNKMIKTMEGMYGEKEVTAGERANLKDALRGVQDQIDEVQKTDRVLFNDDGTEKPIPPRSMWKHESVEIAREKDWTDRRDPYDALVTLRDSYLQKQQDWVKMEKKGDSLLDGLNKSIAKDISGTPETQAESQAQAKAQAIETANRAKQAMFGDKPVPPMTKHDPFNLKTDQEFTRNFPMLRLIAAADPEKILYVRLPTGRVAKIPPAKSE